MRWRVNSREYGYPLSKKGLLRGYIKYGAFAYLSWYYFKVAITPSQHGHGHDSHHGEEHGHGAAGHHGEDKKNHHWKWSYKHLLHTF